MAGSGWRLEGIEWVTWLREEELWDKTGELFCVLWWVIGEEESFDGRKVDIRDEEVEGWFEKDELSCSTESGSVWKETRVGLYSFWYVSGLWNGKDFSKKLHLWK